MSIRHAVPPKLKRKFVSLLSKGKSIKFISDEYDLDYTLLRPLLKKDLKEIRARTRETIVEKSIELYKKGYTITEIAARFNTIPAMRSYIVTKLSIFITKDIKEQHRTNLFLKRKRVKTKLYLSKIADCATDDEAAKKLGVTHQSIQFMRTRFGIPPLSTHNKKIKKEKMDSVFRQIAAYFKKGIPFSKIKVIMGLSLSTCYMSVKIHDYLNEKDRKAARAKYRASVRAEKREKWIAAFKGCTTNAETAKKLGIHPSSVWLIRKNYNIPLSSVLNGNRHKNGIEK